jgi:hypothetical protein
VVQKHGFDVRERDEIRHGDFIMALHYIPTTPRLQALGKRLPDAHCHRLHRPPRYIHNIVVVIFVHYSKSCIIEGMNAIPLTISGIWRHLTGKDDKSVLKHLLDCSVGIPLSTMDIAEPLY